MLEEQRRITDKGGTMRLGAQPAQLQSGSKASDCYGTTEIVERHRHRYELNPEYRERLERAGLLASGRSPDGALAEVVEIANHPWFVAVQYHPEFKSKPMEPHPLFRGFVEAALQRHQERVQMPV
jgi:CTP synthase